MNRKRERLEIIRDILLAIRTKGQKARPTHILYKSNLSSDMLKQYLADLIEKKFIIEEEEIEKKSKKVNKLYSLTDKGYGYIDDFKAIKALMESYGLDD